jgi:tetratricopeptide (TPR) repeat protein
MRTISIILVTMLCAILGSAPSGGATEPSQLDRLFVDLQQAASPSEARRIERQIWTAWLTYRGDAGQGDPGIVNRHMRQGVMSLRARNFDSAERSFARALEADPEFPEAWNRRATARRLRGDFEGSINDFAAALALEPRHFGALSGLGDIYLARNDLERARYAFERALEINPHLDGVRHRLDRVRATLRGLPV